ncbi:MAG: alginate lyase family protein [Bacteroides sp.]|nr:alginate lyase family protein [Bacteroides sp.]
MLKIPHGFTAYKALIRQADKELEREPETVADKAVVAASGDVHDYISMGPYWWPDPSKPDGLPYIRRGGERNPEIEKLDRFKLSRFIRSVRLLSYAWYFSGEQKYADKAAEFMQVWFMDPATRMNPNLNFGQTIPGRNNNQGRGEGIIETYDFVEMTACVDLLAQGGAIQPELYRGVQRWFSDLLEWMLTSEIGLSEKAAKNNHGLSYDVQVTAYALFTGQEEIAREYIREFPETRFYKQVEPDGSQPLELARTLALHYTIFNIEHMLDLCWLAKRVDMDLFPVTSEDGRSIGKAVEFILPWLGKPQKSFPYQQIKEWDEKQDALCWMIRRVSYLEDKEEYNKLFRKYCKTKDSDLRWLLYPAF